MLNQNNKVGYYFVAPALILMIVILGFPAIASVMESFGIWSKGPVGFEAYQRLASDTEFFSALRNTAVFVVTVVFFHMVIGMSVALLLNIEDTKLRWLFRVVAILPWTMPDIIGGLIFRFIFDTMQGGVNAVLTALGAQNLIDWLGRPDLALGTVIFAEIWRGYPYVMLILLAGMQAIPKDQYEAAEIDGVGGWKTFRYVTIPNLKPMIWLAVVLDAVWECRLFGMIFGMTGGGPGNSTETLSLMVYKEYFQFFQTAYASSIAVVLAAILMVMAVPYVRLTLGDGDESE